MAVTVKRHGCGRRLPGCLRWLGVQGLLGLLGLLTVAAPTRAAGPGAPFEPLRSAPVAASSSAPAGAPDPRAEPADAPDGSTTALLGVHRAGPSASALIDGRWWPVGSQLRGARLIAIQRQQATLRHPDGRLEVLALHPGTSGTATSTATSTAPSTGAAAKTPTTPAQQTVRTP